MKPLLKLISTPIGNLSDLSERAIESFKEGTFFLAEDTRELFKLLDLMGIDKKSKFVESFNDHDQAKVKSLVDKYFDKESLNIVSDAGSPVLSDPAYPLVKEWVNRGGRIESIPGPSAVTVALEVSAMAPIPFSFHGFLPRKSGAIKDYIGKLRSKETHIFFESPHRIEGTLELISKEFSSYEVCVVRELTKKFEQHLRFKATDWDLVKEDLVQKGEFVILLRNEGGDQNSSDDISNAELTKLAEKYMAKPSPKGLAKILSEITGENVNDIYKKVSFSKK